MTLANAFACKPDEKCVLCGQPNDEYFTQRFTRWGSGWAHIGCAEDAEWSERRDTPQDPW